jgi:predicted RNase H-like HicB family nuclease
MIKSPMVRTGIYEWRELTLSLTTGNKANRGAGDSGPIEEKKAMKRHFPVIIEQDKEGIFIGECPVLQGCRSYGHTVEEAIDNIQEVIAVCLEDAEPSTRETLFVGIRDLEVLCRDRSPERIAKRPTRNAESIVQPMVYATYWRRSAVHFPI